ncbi:MAG: RsmD family RNA methyltransferase [Candidatus Limnocylindrales bacterium]
MPEAGRVIAGTARGIRLEGAPSGTRPLSDRVKQALFASLDAEGVLVGDFLDLFAGIGAAGIEALSRGATSATFVEHDARASALIDANLKRTRLSAAKVVRADVLLFLSAGSSRTEPPFVASVVDPPYDEPLLTPTLELLGDAGRGWLVDGAVVVAKHFWRDAPAPRIGSLMLDRQRRFGETMLSFYRQTMDET